MQAPLRHHCPLSKGCLDVCFNRTVAMVEKKRIAYNIVMLSVTWSSFRLWHACRLNTSGDGM